MDLEQCTRGAARPSLPGPACLQSSRSPPAPPSLPTHPPASGPSWCAANSGESGRTGRIGAPGPPPEPNLLSCPLPLLRKSSSTEPDRRWPMTGYHSSLAPMTGAVHRRNSPALLAGVPHRRPLPSPQTVAANCRKVSRETQPRLHATTTRTRQARYRPASGQFRRFRLHRSDTALHRGARPLIS